MTLLNALLLSAAVTGWFGLMVELWWRLGAEARADAEREWADRKLRQAEQLAREAAAAIAGGGVTDETVEKLFELPQRIARLADRERFRRELAERVASNDLVD